MLNFYVLRPSGSKGDDSQYDRGSSVFTTIRLNLFTLWPLISSLGPPIFHLTLQIKLLRPNIGPLIGPRRSYFRQFEFSSTVALLICCVWRLRFANWAYREKNSKSVFDFLTYSRETGFSFSYEEVENLHRPIEPSKDIDRVSESNNSLSFGAKQNALRQIVFAL